MTLAVDCSNYTGELTPVAVRRWKRAGIQHVIVQSIDPPSGYPASCTRQQIQTCLDAGLTVDAYVWLWFDLDVNDIHRKLSLLDDLPVRTLWLDVEDMAAKKYDQATTEAKVQAALDVMDAYGTWLERPKGIYTGHWFWTDPFYMANTQAWKDRVLWDAHYDGVPRANVGFVPYGGWKRCAIKQYAGTSTVGGVGNVDRDALSTAEAALCAR